MIPRESAVYTRLLHFFGVRGGAVGFIFVWVLLLLFRIPDFFRLKFRFIRGNHTFFQGPFPLYRIGYSFPSPRASINRRHWLRLFFTSESSLPAQPGRIKKNTGAWGRREKMRDGAGIGLIFFKKREIILIYSGSWVGDGTKGVIPRFS